MKFVKKIRFKYLVGLLSVSIVPILFFSFYSLQSNRKFYNTQIEQASRNEVRRITNRINGNYEDVKNILNSLLFSTYDGENLMTTLCSQEALGNNVTPSQRLKNYRMFKYICSNLLENANNVDGVYLFCENDHVYSYMVNQNYGIERQYKNDDWYNELINSTSSLEISDMVNINVNVYGNTGNCFLAARKFQSVKNDHTAVLAVVCKDSIFDDVSGDNNLPWGKSLIVDGDGNVVWGECDDINLTQDELKQLSMKENDDSGMLHTDDVQKAVIYGKLDINDWVVVSDISFESFYDVFMNNTYILIILIILDVIAIVWIVVYMDRKHIRPIVHLANIMGTSTEQGFLFHNEYKGREDEIGILYAYYEKMLNKIDTLIKEKYENEIKILKSRLRNLTSQINAHFIFNTLENISCLAQIEGNRQIGIMSKSLGDMLRYSMDVDGDFVRLDKEIEHISNYLNVQEVRFDNEIYLNLMLEKGTEKRKVMKFMLQPIVENAIEHGMGNQEEPFVITIAACMDDEDMVIRIADSGVGMDKETLDKVRRRIYEPSKVEEDMKCFNIGLVNIHERIQLLFSTEYGLGIESEKDEGTTVILRIPWM